MGDNKGTRLERVTFDLGTWVALIGLIISPAIAVGTWAINREVQSALVQRQVTDLDNRVRRIEDVVLKVHVPE